MISGLWGVIASQSFRVYADHTHKTYKKGGRYIAQIYFKKSIDLDIYTFGDTAGAVHTDAADAGITLQ